MKFQSWAIYTGASIGNSEMSLTEIRDQFKDALYVNNDFSLYRFDSTAVTVPFPPIASELNFGFGFPNAQKKFWKEAELRFKIGASYLQAGYQNYVYEQFQNSIPTNSDTIIRDYYSFIIERADIYLGADMVKNTRYIGKNERFRAWYGFSFQVGLSNYFLSSYHLNGFYLGYEDTLNIEPGPYLYSFPPISYTTSGAMVKQGSNLNIGLGGLGGIEWALMEKRKIHIGMQFNAGALLVTRNNISPEIVANGKFFLTGRAQF